MNSTRMTWWPRYGNAKRKKKSENEIQEGAGSQRQPIDVTITNIYTLNTLNTHLDGDNIGSDGLIFR